jgi:hypothetical protein
LNSIEAPNAPFCRSEGGMRQPNLNILRPWWRADGARRDGGLRRRWQTLRQVLLDHFGLVAGLLLLVCALLWAVGEHGRHVVGLRVAETNRQIAAFHDAPVGDAWRRVADAWQARQAAQHPLLRRIASLSGAALQAELGNYRAFVIDTVVEHGLARDIDTVIRFYRRLAACVRIGSCDARLAAGRFGSAAWSFRDQHYYWLLEEYDVDEIDGVIDVIAPRAAGRKAF